MKAGALVPGDTCHAVLNPIEINEPDAVAIVQAIISYRTVAEGSGKVVVHPVAIRYFFDGDIAEFLIFNRALTFDERQSVGTYLSQR